MAHLSLSTFREDTRINPFIRGLIGQIARHTGRDQAAWLPEFFEYVEDYLNEGSKRIPGSQNLPNLFRLFAAYVRKHLDWDYDDSRGWHDVHVYLEDEDLLGMGAAFASMVAINVVSARLDPEDPEEEIEENEEYEIEDRLIYVEMAQIILHLLRCGDSNIPIAAEK
jgi:hypothetical protein